jgi:indolepyruvate ferredoxin oxidoreductase beta subunit
MLVTALEPFVNITNCPAMEEVIASVKGYPLRRLIEAAALAKEAGLARAVNTVMVGAASPFLPLRPETLENTIAAVFTEKQTTNSEAILTANIKAFQLGRKAAEAL